MTYFNEDEIFLAYKKVKHFFYYDNANLIEKKKIADFENDLFFSDKNSIKPHNVQEIKGILFERVTKFITTYFDGDIDAKKVLKERISLIKLPKSLRKQSLDIITNKANINENLKVERFSYFADMPIELHIISVLWILYSGRYLNSSINSSSYANCLDMEFLNNRNQPSSNFKLFKPYFVQYQTWRDTAITKAEDLLKEGRNVTILSLDIKNYYHSVRINLLSTFKQIESQIIKENRNSDEDFERVRKINDWLLIIHELYKEKCIKSFREIFENQNIDPNEFNLPVGLISSGLLANYYLKELDERIINKINPAFYGRYVDDLMFVFSDLNDFVDKDLNSSIITFLDKNFVKKDILDFEVKNEYIKDTYFKNGNYLDLKECITRNDRLKKHKESLDFDENKTNVFLTDNIKFKIKTLSYNNKNDVCKKIVDIVNYDELTIQSSKVVLHYLDHKESRAIINIFKRKLDNQRSEFRFLPDEDEISEKFDEEAFELRYNDSINKFRSISDFSENKYGASKFLAKKIFAKSFGDKEVDNDSDNQILTFFKGEIAIKFYSLWEKVATYFIVSNREDYLFKFIKNIEKAILHTDFSFQTSENKRNKGNQEDESKILFEYLSISVAIPLALNPNFISYQLFNESDKVFFKDIRALSLRIRKSNLIRHSLMSIPSCNLTNILNTNLSLLENDFNKYKHDNSSDFNIFEINKPFAFLAPYYIQFHDVNILRIIQVITGLNDIVKSNHGEFDYLYPPKKDKKDKLKGKVDSKDIDIVNSIPDDSFKLYYFINYSWKFNIRLKDVERTKKKYFTINKLNETQNSNSQSLYVNVTGDKIDDNYSDKINKNIAIANIKINQSDMFASMTGHANIKKSRRKNIFGLINEADKHQADLLVFPEVSIPYSWIRLLAERSHKRFMGIVAGLEHWVNSNNVVFNFMVTILPFKINYYTTSIIKLRLKNHYSHFEKHQIKGYRLLIPNENLENYKMSYDLFHWKKTYFSIYNCFELADINHRSLFKSKVDFIIASEYNKDTSYFADIAGAWVRDIHSYFIQVNSSDFGDSRIIQPSKSFCKDVIQVKGGNNSTILVGNLDIQKLRDFQYKEYHLQKDDIDAGKTVLKPTPPDFDRKNVKIRIENKEF
ncbi:hypothetical protein [Chryseobacterium contaminans]|uniref:hypothetical protein n=1 Tax=Chryseobacterium contaminans TaxID=1423959 RepID=UPI0030183308